MNYAMKKKEVICQERLRAKKESMKENNKLKNLYFEIKKKEKKIQ